MIKFKNILLTITLVLLILINIFKDRGYYTAETYRPDTIVNAWNLSNTNAAQAHIKYIGGYINAYDDIQVSDTANDLIAAGASQLVCYNAVFGYRLEYFPFKSLHPGAILKVTNGYLNIKNPACYLYPQENGCTLGDHFKADQREAAQDFANYKPYPFNFSTTQKLANCLTEITLSLLAILFTLVLLGKILRIAKDK